MRCNARKVLVVLLSLLGVAACGGGEGGGGSGSDTGQPSSRVARFAYVANFNAKDVSAYTISAATGALTRIPCEFGGGDCIGTDFAAGTGPRSVTVDPSSKFAYVANQTSNDVSAYTINAVTGALTRIPCVVGVGVSCNGNNFLAGTVPASVAVDPSGKFAYVANQTSNDVSAYTINATTGALTRILCVVGVGVSCNFNGDFLAGTVPASVTVDPSGKFAYVANFSANDVSAYTIGAATGALARIPCEFGGGDCIGTDFAAGTGPVSVTVNPLGKFAYVANQTSNDVSAYTINATTGALIRIPCVVGVGVSCNGNNFLTGTVPASVAVDPLGKFAYVANQTANDVSAYTINAATGALTRILCVVAVGVDCNINNNFSAGTGPVSVAVDPSGKFAYVANFNSKDVSAYTINAATGALTQIPCAEFAGCIGSNFQAENGPRAVTTTH